MQGIYRLAEVLARTERAAHSRQCASCFSASTPSATTLAPGASSKVEGEADQPAVRDRNSKSLEVSWSSSPASAATIGAACLIGGSSQVPKQGSCRFQFWVEVQNMNAIVIVVIAVVALIVLGLLLLTSAVRGKTE
jgi:hypothetical protein